MKNILIVSYAYIAAVIGAGFASGQEILCYFNRFGRNGFFGVITASLILSVFAGIVFLTCVRRRIRSFSEFVDLLPGRYTPMIIRVVTGVFAFAILIVMLSAFGVICTYITGIPGRISTLLASAACVLLLYRGSGNMISINGIIGIMLAAGIAFCCFYILRYREFHAFSYTGKIQANACIYSGYNLVSVLPFLVMMSRRLRSAAEASVTAIISGIVLFILMSLIFCILSIYAGRINLGEFPMLTMAHRQNSVLAAFYGILLAASVVTTLISAIGAVSQSFRLNGNLIRSGAVSAFAYTLSGTGFSRLIDTAYRFCGIIGFILCGFVFIMCIVILINKDYKRLRSKIRE